MLAPLLFTSGPSTVSEPSRSPPQRVARFPAKWTHQPFVIARRIYECRWNIGDDLGTKRLLPAPGSLNFWPQIPDAVRGAFPYYEWCMASIPWDLRYALRQIQRSPAFFLAATLLIAAGITVNTAVFSLIDAVILRHLPVHDPERLVQLFGVHPRIPARSYFEFGLLHNLREHSTTLTDVVGQMEMTAPITHGREVERIHPHSVTDDYFQSLGVSAALGRVFTADDDMPAVLSDAYWRRSFGADPNVIGQTIRLYNRPFAIVGVAPPSFGGTVIDTSADLWIPMRRSFNFLDLPTIHVNDEYVNQSFAEIVARLRPGTTLAQAQSEATLFWKQV